MPKLSNTLLSHGLMAAFIFSCGKPTPVNVDENFKPLRPSIDNQEIDGQPKFRSLTDPGQWKDEAETHNPIVSVNKMKDYTKVTIFTSFEPARNHYPELILISDYRGNELAKENIGTYTKAKAEFILGNDLQGTFYAVMKCNLHDMWRSRFEIPAD